MWSHWSQTFMYSTLVVECQQLIKLLRILCSVQLLSCVWLFATPWIAVLQASLSITNSQRLLRLMSIESVVPSNHLILRRPLHLLPPIFPRTLCSPCRCCSTSGCCCLHSLRAHILISFLAGICWTLHFHGQERIRAHGYWKLICLFSSAFFHDCIYCLILIYKQSLESLQK